jgi:23S rRNA (guanine745-N1)-methyltransferase
MVGAREAFLGGGHYAPIAGAVSAAATSVAATSVAATSVGVAVAVGHAAGRRGCVVDLGSGTGYYLAAVLAGLGGDRSPPGDPSRPGDRRLGWHGLALDASRPGLRRAVRADPRIAGVVCDAWGPLPVADGAADLVLSVFAPRNAPEIARILAPHGRLIVVTPGPDHLAGLVASLGLIGVDPDKPARLHAKLSPVLRAVSAASLDFELTLDRDAALAVAAMGPSAHHVEEAELRARVAGLPEAFGVSASVRLETFALS